MIDKRVLTEKFKIVGMYNADISSEEYPIIGVQSLATCVGILLYSPKYQKAIVAHAATEYFPILMEVLDLLFENKMDDSPIKYLVIPGFYYNHYEVAENLQKAFSSLYPLFVPFSSEEILEGIIKDPELPAYQFAFDASRGIFVSEEVLYGADYDIIHNNKKFF